MIQKTKDERFDADELRSMALALTDVLRRIDSSGWCRDTLKYMAMEADDAMLSMPHMYGRWVGQIEQALQEVVQKLAVVPVAITIRPAVPEHAETIE